MKKVMTIKEYERMSNMYDTGKYICKCGHRVIIPFDKDKKLCRWCGRYVFKNKKDEFVYKLKEKIKK